MSKESFAEWLESVDSYYVRQSDLRAAEDEHNVTVSMGSITVHMNDDEEIMIPHRDIRHGNWSEIEE